MNRPAPLTREALRRVQAQDAIVHHTTLASASMAIPVPLVDVATELAIQVRMARKLCALYGAQFNAAGAREVITGIVGGLSFGALSTAALRYISFASYFAGTLPSAGLTAAYTFAIGELLLERLEKHGRIDLPPADSDAPSTQEATGNHRQESPSP